MSAWLLFPSWVSREVESSDCSNTVWFKSWPSHLGAMWHWASYLTSPGLIFLIRVKRIVSVSLDSYGFKWLICERLLLKKRQSQAPGCAVIIQPVSTLCCLKKRDNTPKMESLVLSPTPANQDLLSNLILASPRNATFNQSVWSYQVSTNDIIYLIAPAFPKGRWPCLKRSTLCQKLPFPPHSACKSSILYSSSELLSTY